MFSEAFYVRKSYVNYIYCDAQTVKYHVNSLLVLLHGDRSLGQVVVTAGVRVAAVKI